MESYDRFFLIKKNMLHFSIYTSKERVSISLNDFYYSVSSFLQFFNQIKNI